MDKSDYSFHAYPLVTRALQEQANAFHYLGREKVPEDLEAITRRTLDILDNYTDRPAAEKENIMAMSVLMHAPPFVLNRHSGRFAETYNAHIQLLVDIVVSDHGVTDKDQDILQIYSASFVAHCEGLLKQITVSPQNLPVPLHEIREGLEDHLEQRELIKDIGAPRLAELEEGLIKHLFNAIDSLSQPQTQPKPVKKPGPGF